MLRNPFLLHTKKIFREHCPGILILGSRVASRTILFREERAFLRGKRMASSAKKSVLFFSTYRCGTQRIDSILRAYALISGRKALNLGGYWFHRGVVREGEVTSLTRAEEIYPERGYYFGRIRPIAEGFNYRNYHNVSIVRDPRDVMVSFFHSFAYAHTPLNSKFAEEAAEARAKGVDWFVQQPRRFGAIRLELKHILDNTWNREGMFSWKFEDMMSNFDGFLAEIAAYLEISEKSEETRERLFQEQDDALKRGGSQLAHLRSGRSGEYKEALKEESVARLNAEFKELIGGFGYES